MTSFHHRRSTPVRVPATSLLKVAEPNRDIVFRTKENCAQLFFLFTGLFRNLIGMRPLEFVSQARLINRNLMVLRDPTHSGFQDGLSDAIPDLDSLVDWQREFIDSMHHVTDVYCVGVSAGSLAAMYAGHQLGAKTVWTFGARPPPTKEQLRYRLKEGTKPEFDIRDLDYGYIGRVIDTLSTPNAETEYRLYYVSSNEKDSYVHDLLKVCPHTISCAVEPPPGYEHPGMQEWDHSVLTILNARGELSGIFPPFRGSELD